MRWSTGEREPWLLRPCLPQYFCPGRYFPVADEGKWRVTLWNTVDVSEKKCVSIYLCVREWASVVTLALSSRKACLIIAPIRKDSRPSACSHSKTLCTIAHDRG